MTDLRGALELDRSNVESAIRDESRRLALLFDAQRDVAADDEHDPEGPTLSLQRAESEAMLAQSRRHLNEVEAAIERMDAGSYGLCGTCGRSIQPARLDARPYATDCIVCATKKDQR